MKYFRLSHEIIGAAWDSNKGVWEVKIKDLKTGDVFTDTAEIIINGGGVLKWVPYTKNIIW